MATGGYSGYMESRPDIMLSAGPSAPLNTLAAALEDAGFDAVLVGGVVRDAIMGRASADLDMVTNATVAQVRDIANESGAARSIYAVGERFGTLGVVLTDGSQVEVSRYREQAMSLPSLEQRIAADVMLRDLTVNSLAFDLATGTVLDPLGGAADIEIRVLKAPGDPHARFAEDPLRVLRLARFVSQLGFSVDVPTLNAARTVAPRLAGISVERIRDEFTKLLVGGHPAEGLRCARDTGALAVTLPEVDAMHQVTQPSFHDLDVFEHTLQTVALCPATPVLRWAALLHDIGKPVTRTVEPDGRIRFFTHAKVGAQLAESLCRRLRFSNADTAAITHLVREHMRLGDAHVDNRRAMARAVNKLDLWERGAASASPIVSAEDALELTMADFGSTAHRTESPRVRAVLAEAIAQARGGRLPVRATSPVSGDELIRELGIAAGYRVGVAKRAIEEAIANGDLAPDDRAGALQVARDAVARPAS